MKPAGKPDAGNRHVRFDERGWETERWPIGPQATAPILDSTKAEVAEARSRIDVSSFAYGFSSNYGRRVRLQSPANTEAITVITIDPGGTLWR